MLNIVFSIGSPYKSFWKLLWRKSIRITKNKTVEMSLSRTHQVLGFGLNITPLITWHPGFIFSFQLLTFVFEFIFVDNCHFVE